MNYKSQILLKPTFSLFVWILMSFHITQAQKLIPYQTKRGKWGYKNKEGKKVIKPHYHSATAFSNTAKYARVSKSKKYGIINRQGKLVVPLQYSFLEITDAQELHYLIQVKKNDQAFYGLMGQNNQIILPATHTSIKKLIPHVVVSPLIIEKKGKFALFSNRGKSVTDFIYQAIKSGDYESAHVLAKQEGKFGFFSKYLGNKIIPFVYDEASIFYKGLAKVRKDEKSYQIDYRGALYKKPSEDKEISLIVEDTGPQPTGGLQKFYKYISQNLCYP